MRIARTLSLYVLREALLYCALAFVILALVLLAQNLLRRLDELFLIGMTGADLVVVLRCLLPIALSYAIPVSFLVGLVLALRRLGGDGELLALRASGLGPNHLLLPFLALGLAATLFSSWIAAEAEPEARRTLVKRFKQVAARGAIVEAGKFRDLGSHVVFVEDRSRDGELSGVMIYDRSRTTRRFRIFAARGRVTFDPEAKRIRLDLEDGDVHLDPDPARPERYERIRFETFRYDLDVAHLIGTDFWPVRPKQMTVPELRAVVARAERGDPLRELDERDPRAYALEIHRRRAQPYAPLLFAAIGVPIALASEHRGRHLGLLLVLAIALAYYALGAAAVTQAEAGRLAPGLAVWLPNLVLGGAAIAAIARGRERIPK